jgi:hypothetical protein
VVVASFLLLRQIRVLVAIGNLLEGTPSEYGVFRGGRRSEKVKPRSRRGEDHFISLEHALWLLSLLVHYEPSDPPRCQRPDDMRYAPGRARIEEKDARQASYPQQAPTTIVQA